MDGFVEVRDLIEVLVSYISNDEKTAITIRDLNNIIPNLDSMSPRTRCEQVINYILEELKKKGLKPINVYKMADSKNAGSIQVSVLEQTFKKFLPHVRNEVFSEAMNAFRKSG